jgi:NhaP-type Na+/H+ or K+/H+ antiporter
MTFELWYLLLGGLLIAIAVVSSALKRVPVTTTMLYLVVGVGLGPLGLGVAHLDPVAKAHLLERLSELAVIVSLFTAGLKLREPLHDALWRVPLRLAFVSMALTVGLVAAVGVWGVGLPLGAAVVLGAVLAPTDPVLASDVQVESAGDRDQLRFGLTGEAGLNDGTAFPFLMLGLGLLGTRELGSWGWRWLAVDVAWAIAGGLAIGAVAGALVGRFVLHLRKQHREALGRDEFLALGLIGASYGAAVLVHAYGFLAVFAAALALRAVERGHTGAEPRQDVAAAAAVGRADEVAVDPEKAPAYMAEAVLAFNERLERILELALVLAVGFMLTPARLEARDLWFVAALLLLVRPLAVVLGLAGERVQGRRLAMLSWFGIRGIGSLYYLAHAVGLGLPESLAQRVVSLTLAAVVVSVVVHGVSVTPLMNAYLRRDAPGGVQS